MIIYKSNNLFLKNLSDGFYVIVNTWRPNSLRIINEAQLKILNEVNNKKTLDEISFSLNIDKKNLYDFFNLFLKQEIINYNPDFSRIEPFDNPSSLDLWIHATNKCNLTCNYCYISTLNSTGGMSKVVRERLIEKLKETALKRNLKVVKIRLAGGEPLTQFRYWKDLIVESKTAFNKINCDLEVGFITNLTLLNDEIVEFSKDYNIQFGVSIDGFDFYNDITRKFHNGNGTFDIIDKNIDRLIKNNIRLSTSTVVTNSNMEGLPALTEYLIQKKVFFRYSIVKGEYINRDVLSDFLNISYEIMEKEIENGWEFSKYHQLCDLKPSKLGFQTCSSGLSGGAIYVDGSVYYCHVQVGGESGLTGSIFDSENDLVEVIRKGNHYEGMKSDDCKTCNYKYICTSGCPMYRVDGKDLNCSLYHKFIPRIYELQGKERLKLLLDRLK
ncbi:radical SAM/SPASM domain-containing protein [Emticicia sp. BO119]|uniref:radical SAM/SPASM domain-containing protein n=1 Tax=Emticicia sp. BO119 TaxID=2757768 RepID=UPI0015F0D077|nr:radical SAM protein [Emticicia sp. BO119]MBA4853759.1 radical SAM protein [Emticicia sp. BO119]